MTSQPCSLPLSPVRPPGYLLTSDLLAWLCPAADVTLAACRLTPTLSSSSSSLSSTRPQSYLSGKKKELHHLLLLPLAAPATDRLRHCGTHDSAPPPKMAWSIWTTPLNAAVPSVSCCLPPSAARWRTGQGHSAARQNWDCVQIVTHGLQVMVEQQQQQQSSPEGCSSCPVLYTWVNVGRQRKERPFFFFCESCI